MHYLFQEGRLTLPSDKYQDNTVNMLRFPALEGSISITREALSPDIELSDYLAGQLSAIKREIKMPSLKRQPLFAQSKVSRGVKFTVRPNKKASVFING
ncbi:DcrB-related protein [Providencia stuartii]|uniref:DcrB-related protein n=1 Tax=Providencia stuartii TaxID=588 RepID=UPI0040676D6A